MQSSLNKLYKKKFYKNRNKDTVYSAKKIISLIETEFNKDSLIVDVGCGTGTWLSVLENEYSCKTIGYEGQWIEKHLYEANGELFKMNFENDNLVFDKVKKIDLIICLEVFEHLSNKKCLELIDIFSQNSDLILFSAAIPNQGGTNHINEKKLSYWVKLFNEKGFNLVDNIRNKIWEDNQIKFWYRQNIVLFSKHKINKSENNNIIDIVHPVLLNIKNKPSLTIGINHILKKLLSLIRG